jgi:hypothetical protein
MYNNCSHPNRRNDGAKDHPRKIPAQIGPQLLFRNGDEERVDHNGTSLNLLAEAYASRF